MTEMTFRPRRASSLNPPAALSPLAVMLCAAGLVAAPAALAADAAAIKAVAPIVVTATRDERPSFDLPVSIDVVSADAIGEAQPLINASESLARVPGLVSPNQYRMSSDQQLSSRGFGARAGFGVRGIRIYADGVPQTMPDGQGTTGVFSLSSAERMEVMRGPFSALYGNSSGGVVQIFTRSAPARPTLSASYSAGSFDTWRAGAQYAGRHGTADVVLDASRYDTGGYRDHSAARRDQLNAKLTMPLSDADTLTVVANHFDLPMAQDPLGLTRVEMEADPRQAGAGAVAFDTGGFKKQTHVGATLEHRFATDRKITAVFYGGERSSLQRLPFAGGAGLSAGGVSTIARDFWGADLRYTHATEVAGGRLSVTGGLNYETMADARKGYANNSGVQGALRRDEDNTARNFDQYVQAEWALGEDWLLSGGLRHSTLRIKSDDHFIVGANPDDSGAVTYRNTSPVVGVLYHLTPAVNVYANLGRGYETPTLIELAYVNAGSGLNFALQPAQSRHAEVGVKAFVGTSTAINLAAFRVTTRNEIVADVGGPRTTYKNAGRTSRSGLELALTSQLLPNLDASLSYALLNARFDEAFGAVNAGNRIPGAPKVTAFAELAWKLPSIGMSTALEARYTGAIQVNDVNTDVAPAATVVNWRLAFEQTFGEFSVKEFARIENIGDTRYVGGVNVNDGNGRFFAPAPGRNAMIGVSVARRF